MRLLTSHIVPSNIDDIRIYAYCVGLFPQLPSRKSVKKALDKGQIKLNGEDTETGFWLKGGEFIELYDLERTPPKPYQLKFEVIYEDEYMAVIKKPAGLLTSGNTFKTVTNALLYNLKSTEIVDAMEWPKPVHRLDKSTSGLLIIAKTKTAQAKLGLQFEQNKIEKTYYALVLGRLEGKGQITTKIEGKSAITYYESIESRPTLKSNHLSLVKLSPKTGRTHQLRIHMSSIEHAILGDQLYSPEKLKLKCKGLFLSASQLKFRHPKTAEILNLTIEIPAKYLKRLRSEAKRWENYYLE